MNKRFWLLWVLASGVAGAAIALVARAAAYNVGYSAGEAGGAIIGEAALGAVALGGFIGSIGFAQWLVLVRQVPWAGWWFLASALSGAVSGATFLASRAALLAPAGEATAAIVGVIMGLTVFWMTQWVVLRSRVAFAGWLALASVLGLLAAVMASVAVGALIENELGRGSGFGFGYGAVTGAAVIILSRRAIKSPNSASTER